MDLTDPERIKKADETEDMSIRHYIERSADYRKAPLRKFLIEPFLITMHCHGVVASPRELPLSHMTDALFDWVGVEKKCRPTNSGVRTVARYIKRRLGEIADERAEMVSKACESALRSGRKLRHCFRRLNRDVGPSLDKAHQSPKHFLRTPRSRVHNAFRGSVLEPADSVLNRWRLSATVDGW